MIIYSVEISVDKNTTQSWLKWMTLQHIPDVMKTNLFTGCEIFQNLNTENTYTIQYKLETLDNYLTYQTHFASDLQKDHMRKFKGKFKAKRTLMMEMKKID
jgi:hypothetical protein